MFDEILRNVREKAPLIHNLTNYVTANDCANMLLACGASPIMAGDIGEVEEITAISSGLAINTGTLDQRAVPAMLAAGRCANRLGRPVVLDPVGAGASGLRTETALALLRKIRFAVIRGNFSEIRTLAEGNGSARGVDAGEADRVTEENLDQAVRLVREFAGKTGSVVAVTGAIDLVAGESAVYCIRNGDPMMSRVTGTGCQLTSLTAAFAAANPGRVLEAAAAAVSAMGLCGEIARGRMGGMDGTGSLRMYLIDAMSNLTPEELEKGARYEIRQGKP